MSQISNSGVFTSSYKSSPTAWAAFNTYTFAHGLGVKPRAVQVYLECKSAADGHAVGDRVEATVEGYSAGTGGMGIAADATNVYVAIASKLVFCDQTNAAGVPSATNYDLIVEAFA